MYLKIKLPRVYDAKIKEGIFVESQIRKLKRDEKFNEELNIEKAV